MRLGIRRGTNRWGYVDHSSPQVRLVIVGLGGTGGYAFYHLARLAASLKGKAEWQIVLADGDAVEEKNLVRQNFTAADVGRPKVECLSRRYGDAYGMAIPYWPRYVEDGETLARLLSGRLMGFEPDLPVLVGCVDNNATRRLFHRVFETWKEPLVYVDSGNDEWSGQVVLGARSAAGVLLPPVAHYYPDILEDDDPLPSQLSCSELAVSSPQNIATNVLAGALVFGLVNQLLAGEGIETCGATFNAKTGQVRSLWIEELPLAPGWPFRADH